MPKVMKTIAVLSLFLAVCFGVVRAVFGFSVFLTLAVTFGTIAYHFWMRLIIGVIFNSAMKNRVDYNRRWFRAGKREQELYKKLKVSRWKNKMPTYDADVFNPEIHSWDEIAQATCQSELVHETIIIFSFVPVLFSIWFGDAAVFIITSLLGAAFDGMFVIMQRFNRPRILRMVKRSAKKQAEE